MRSPARAAFLFAAFLLSMMLGAVPLARAGDTAATICGYDALTRPGQAVAVKSKLERVATKLNPIPLFSPAVEGEDLAFYLVEMPGKEPGQMIVLEEAKYLGKARTNGSGLASFDFSPEAEGIYKIETRVRQGSDYMALPAPNLVGSFKAEDRIVLVDLDETVTDTSALKVAITKSESIKLREGADEVLNSLVKDHKLRLVYLSSRDDDYLNLTRSWMDEKGLPPGPLFVWDFWSKDWSEETFKSKLVKTLREGFPGMTAGIGDQAADVKAFSASGLSSFIWASSREGLPAEAIQADSWERLKPLILAQPEVEARIASFASGSLMERNEAWDKLSRLGSELMGYCARYRGHQELDLGVAAQLLEAKIHAREAFAASLDTRDADRTLRSLIAAWRQGDPWLIAELYREPSIVRATASVPILPLGQIELVSRTEPGETTVVFKLRIHSALDGKPPSELELKMTELRDGCWRIETPDF